MQKCTYRPNQARGDEEEVKGLLRPARRFLAGAQIGPVVPAIVAGHRDCSSAAGRGTGAGAGACVASTVVDMWSTVFVSTIPHRYGDRTREDGVSRCTRPCCCAWSQGGAGVCAACLLEGAGFTGHVLFDGGAGLGLGVSLEGLIGRRWLCRLCSICCHGPRGLLRFTV